MPSRTPSLLSLILGIAGVIIILAGIQVTATLFNIVALAAVLTLLALPLKQRLERRGLSGIVAYLIVLLLIIGAALALVLIGGLALAQMAVSVPEWIQSFQTQAAALATQSGGAGTDLSGLTEFVDALARVILDVLVSVAAGGIGLAVDGVFVLLVTAFMLAEVEGFVALLKRTVGADNPTYRRVADSTSAVITYLTITAVINFVIAVGDTILLSAVGVPNPLFWGLVSFLFGFIPYIGYWISFLPPFVLAFAGGGIGPALVVLLGYWLINGAVSQIVAPRMYGKGLNLSITLTVVAVLFWGGLLGPVGGMLAVPMTAILRSALLASFPETAWLATVLANTRGKAGQTEIEAGPESGTAERRG